MERQRRIRTFIGEDVYGYAMGVFCHTRLVAYSFSLHGTNPFSSSPTLSRSISLSLVDGCSCDDTVHYVKENKSQKKWDWKSGREDREFHRNERSYKKDFNLKRSNPLGNPLPWFQFHVWCSIFCFETVTPQLRMSSFFVRGFLPHVDMRSFITNEWECGSYWVEVLN